MADTFHIFVTECAVNYATHCGYTPPGGPHSGISRLTIPEWQGEETTMEPYPECLDCLDCLDPLVRLNLVDL